MNKLNLNVVGNRVSIGENFSFEIHRTLRIPDDGKTYPLPASLGTFPIFKVEDYKDKVPASWLEHGGIFIPMWQSEAAWINFNAEYSVPVAVKLACGKVCAVSGDSWNDKLVADPQNYFVAGGEDGQRWLDGWKTNDGKVRQFVAVPLGSGSTVEAQLTGKEVVGGVQLQVWESKVELRPKKPVSRGVFRSKGMVFAASCSLESATSGGMGMGAGGLIEQAIKKVDKWTPDTFQLDQTGRVFIHLVNSAEFYRITGQQPPTIPITEQQYKSYGYPWFSTYLEDKGKDVTVNEKLKNLKTVEQLTKKETTTLVDANIPNVIQIQGSTSTIKDGNW